MAANKTKSDEIDPLAGDSDEALDQAIDDLRGALKTDQTGELPDLGVPDDDLGDDLGGDFGGIGRGDDGADEIAADFANPAGDFGDMAMVAPQPAGSPDHAYKAGTALHSNLDLILDIPIEVQIILGSSKMPVSGLMGLTEGAIIALDRKIGEPVDIIVNGRLIGRGEITVLETDGTRFGVKLIEVKGSQKLS